MVLLIQHAFQDVNGLSEDRYVNTFHALPLPLGGDDYAALADSVRDFYAEFTGTSVNAIRSFMANHAFGENASIKIYDLDDPLPRSPLYTEFYDPEPGSSGSLPLPGEVAACLSFSSAPASGVAPARRRGRIYLGPLNVSAVGLMSAGQKSRPNVAFAEAACNEFANLAASMLADGFGLVQYSPTAEVASAVTNCWMDDAWDTQRRRGVDPTSRVTQPVGS